MEPINALEAKGWMAEHSPRALAWLHKAMEASLVPADLADITPEEAQALSLAIEYHCDHDRQIEDELARHQVLTPYSLQLRTNRFPARHSSNVASPEFLADITNGTLTEAKLLQHIAQGQNINIHGGEDESLLGLAARQGHVKIVELLLRHKAQVNLQLEHATSYRYGAPLEDALSVSESVAGLTEACVLLVQHGARLDVYCAYGYPSWYYLMAGKQYAALARVCDEFTARDPVYAKFLANLPCGRLPLMTLLSRQEDSGAALVVAALLRMGAEPLAERNGSGCSSCLRAATHQPVLEVLRASVQAVLMETLVARSSPGLWRGIMRFVVEYLLDFTPAPIPRVRLKN